ncbi:MAG: transposase [Planctomycetota bacterium]|jgi:REP element-mobilizing transposase RayT
MNHDSDRDQHPTPTRSQSRAPIQSRDREGADEVRPGRERASGHERAESSAQLSHGEGGPAVHCGAVPYLITFTTYGTWLHGDKRGAVDRDHNAYGAPFLRPDASRKSAATKRTTKDSVVLNAERRRVVHRTVEQVCEHRGWTLHAVNVRSNHVHVVVSAPECPERVMNALKSWATRKLVGSGLIKRGTAVWTRHGSTRYLWKPRDLLSACEYVSEQQGVDLE